MSFLFFFLRKFSNPLPTGLLWPPYLLISHFWPFNDFLIPLLLRQSPFIAYWEKILTVRPIIRTTTFIRSFPPHLNLILQHYELRLGTSNWQFISLSKYLYLTQEKKNVEMCGILYAIQYSKLSRKK